MPVPAFGYIRIRGSESEHNLRKSLAHFAARQGYELADIFTEYEELGSSAFASLMEALKCSKTTVVIVPTICHFAHLSALRIAIKNLIERETSARVVAIYEPASDDSQPTGR